MDDARFYRIKCEVRILGFDDAPFTRKDREVIIVGTVFRGGTILDGVLSTKVRVDGLDATDKIISLVSSCRFKDVRVIMLDGLGFGGFNLVDIKRVNEETKLPVIVVVRRKPDFKGIDKALDNLPDKDERVGIIKKAGEPVRAETSNGKHIYIQYTGINEEDAKEIVRISATRSLIPEPIRVAHLIGQGIILGQSRGNA
ncbi:MAG: DUF99 family protein [Candidatus Altiarchaeota archaeon]